MKNSLEDLVRDTLATRAHDVDGVELIAPPRATHGRRWVAVGTVVAVAAAILVAVVLAAPWRGTSNRNAGPATVAAPPAGMQWISYHGITLTVPVAWAVTDRTCPGATDANGLVTIGAPPVSTSCMPVASMNTMSFVSLSDLGGEPTGTTVIIDGHEAYRTVSETRPGYGVRASVDTRVWLPDVGVTVGVASDSPKTIDDVLASIEYTPVDHLGCTAQLSAKTSPTVAAGALDVPAAQRVVVCEYARPNDGRQYLAGSRVLTDTEVADLRDTLDDAVPGRSALGVGGSLGLFVYRFTQDDGTTDTVTVDLSARPAPVSDGEHEAELPGGLDRPAPTIPAAYPN